MELGGKKLYAVQVGSDLHIFDDSNAKAIRKKIEAALRRGHTAIHTSEGGWTEWIEADPIVDPTKAGSAAYQWDASGNRVQCRRTHCVCRDGVVDRTVLGTSYRDPTNL